MDIQVIEAKEEDQPVIQNLVSLYVYDLSKIMGWNCPESGMFGGCDDLPEYWGKQPDNPHYAWPDDWQGFPYLIRVDGALAGFALVRQLGDHQPPHYDIGDFFVLGKFRRMGVGQYVAHRLFDTFPGEWEVGQMVGNTPAQNFWREAISGYTGGNYTETVETPNPHNFELTVQRFSSLR